MMARRMALAVVCASVCALPARAQTPSTVDSSTLTAFRWRNIGPANMGGRVSSIVGLPSPSHTFFVAAAAGGIWKTTNAGTTFRPVFDHEKVVSMGEMAIAPSDSMQVWAGTGEEDSRNSISPGGGIYKSVDGGLTWKLMGLEATQQIGRIVVHPRNPDIVWVAALGHAWGPNPERGLYKTSDGGKSWKLTKFISDKAGFIDVAIDPTNPDVLFASSWERVRGPYFLKSGGPGSALWKSTDGGESWSRVQGGGFPSTELGRIGLAIAPSDHNVIYALTEAGPLDAKAKNPKNETGLYRSSDGGATWTKMNDRDTRPFYYSQVHVDPKDPNRVYWSSTPLQFSDDGGKTVRQGAQGIHVDDHALWIDPADPNHWILGNDGGIAQTFDRGGNFDFIDNLPIGQFYEVSYDMAVPYHVCGGLQDNGSWCGPSKRQGPIPAATWATVSGGDGFYTAQDPRDPNTVYAESQGGNAARINVATGERKSLQKPNWRTRYQQVEDSILIERGDTALAPSPAVQQHLAELRRQQVVDSASTDMRFNWNSPLILSPHNPDVVYLAGNRVLKSVKRGDDLVPISPDLSTKDTVKIKVSMFTTGGVTKDATGAETFGTITTLAESYIRPGLLYAGTDDGNVWMTNDGGASWTDITKRFPGVPRGTYVNRIEPSHFDANTFWVAFDNHRNNDFAPYLYVTTDGGKSFRSTAGNLPRGGVDFVHVIREDPFNANLLFVGTDVAAYVSTDRGGTWQRFMEGMPTVPVHDLKIHPRDRDLIAATHGRTIWIVNIAALEQLAGKTLAGATLFDPPVAQEWGDAPVGGGNGEGQKQFNGQSPPYGAEFTYWLPAAEAAATAAAPTGAGDEATPAPRQARSSTGRIAILNAKGDTVQTVVAPAGPGFHRAYWNLRVRQAPKVLSVSEKRDSVLAARRIAVLTDSLVKAGWSRMTIQRVAEQILSGGRSGDFGSRGGAGGPVAGTFVERPAESPARRAGAPGAPGAAGAAPGAEAAQGEGQEGGTGGFEQLREFSDLVRAALPPGSSIGARGGFFGGQGPSMAPAGDYTVALTVGGKTLTTKLRVERGATAPAVATEQTPDDQ
ncbi:MAG TPA: hypothetical protein VF832_20235 [Longimicrobiales bacterium]